jgi:hypothetical protein
MLELYRFFKQQASQVINVMIQSGYWEYNTANLIKKLPASYGKQQIITVVLVSETGFNPEPNESSRCCLIL